MGGATGGGGSGTEDRDVKEELLNMLGKRVEERSKWVCPRLSLSQQ
jgi:hypothetical protein